MVQVLKVVENDTLYDLEFTVKDSAGVVLDLTNVTQIKIKAAVVGGNSLELEGTCNISVPATGGICTYTVQAGELDNVGTYHAELELTYSGGKIITTERFDILVEKDLP